MMIQSIQSKGIFLALLMTCLFTGSIASQQDVMHSDNFSSIDVSLDVDSMDKVMKKALPLYLYYGVKNQSIIVNQSQNWYNLFKLYMGNIHFNQVKIKNGESLGFANDQEGSFMIDEHDLDGNPLRLKVSDLYMDANINCSLTILGWTLNFTHIQINGLSFEVLFREERMSASKWQIEEISKLSYDSSDIVLTWNDSILNKLLIQKKNKEFQWKINYVWIDKYLQLVKTKIVDRILTIYENRIAKPYNKSVTKAIKGQEAIMFTKALDISRNYLIPAAIGAASLNLNKKINAFENQEKFLVPFYGEDIAYALNMTQVIMPIISHETHLIEMHFDGIVHQINRLGNVFDQNQNQQKGMAGKSFVKHERIKDAQSQQIWIHQSTINSYLKLERSQFAKGLTVEVNKYISEDLINLQINNATQLIIKPNMSNIQSKGLQIVQIEDGKFKLSDGLQFVVQIICQDQTQLNNQLSLCFQSKAQVEADFNFEFKDLKIYASLDYLKVETYEIDQQNQLKNPQQLNDILERQIYGEFEPFNNKYKDGLHIGKLYNRFSMLNMVLAETLLTTKIKDGWLYGGFSLRSEVIERNHRKR